MKVCVIGLEPSEMGGVARSTLYLMYLYKILGYSVVWLGSKRIRFSRLSKCDIVCAQYPLDPESSVKLILLGRKTRKILTLHGWVLDETKIFVFTSRDLKDKIKILFVYIMVAINWLLHRYILIPFVYDYVTAVSYITAKKNNVKAVIIPNPTICRDSELSKKLHKNATDIREVVFVTYISIGGGKILSIPRLVNIVNSLNKRLSNLGVKERVVLHIYGKDVPHHIVDVLSKFPCVKFMGYVKDYPDRLKQSDLFLAGYTFPELGHAALEAMCAGVPVAKFTEDPKLEEIMDGFNGILALSDEEMVEKLLNYVLNMNEMKNKLAINARNTIVKRRDPRRVAIMWKILIESIAQAK